MTKIVINTCFGGFGLSDEAYEWLIAHGVKVGKYHQEPLNPKTGLYDIPVPENEGKIIFDRKLEKDKGGGMWALHGRYWETWIDDNRDWPLLVECIEELGTRANGRHANLEIVEVPDDVEWEIDEYDGNEHIAEKHRTWR